jgi:ecdysteroid 2-hydroxylase
MKVLFSYRDGQEWLHYRRILNKIMLSSNSVALMINPCYNAANDLIKNWKNFGNNGQVIPDLENQLYQWSIEGNIIEYFNK